MISADLPLAGGPAIKTIFLVYLNRGVVMARISSLLIYFAILAILSTGCNKVSVYRTTPIKEYKCKHPDFASIAHTPQKHEQACLAMRDKNGILISECKVDKVLYNKAALKTCTAERHEAVNYLNARVALNAGLLGVLILVLVL